MIIAQRRFMCLLALPAIIFMISLMRTDALAENGRSGVEEPSPASSGWAAKQQHRDKALSAYLQQNSVAYVWFKDFPFGVSSGAPFIILQLLPRLAPEEWGRGDNFMEVAGLFRDERNPS